MFKPQINRNYKNKTENKLPPKCDADEKKDIKIESTENEMLKLSTQAHQLQSSSVPPPSMIATQVVN